MISQGARIPQHLPTFYFEPVFFVHPLLSIDTNFAFNFAQQK